jgi:hypothetical protein
MHRMAVHVLPCLSLHGCLFTVSAQESSAPPHPWCGHTPLLNTCYRYVSIPIKGPAQQLYPDLLRLHGIEPWQYADLSTRPHMMFVSCVHYLCNLLHLFVALYQHVRCHVSVQAW